MTTKKIAFLLPRNMYFGPSEATSIDLCVHDSVLSSRFHARSVVVCQEIDGQVFEGFDVRHFRQGPKKRRLREIAEILEDITPDLIVAHQHLPTASMIAMLFPDRPVLLHKHNFVSQQQGFSLRRRYRQINRLAGVIFVSHACRNRFLSDYPTSRPPSYVVHNGLIADDWPRGNTKHREIIAVGDILPGKGMLEIAGALAEVIPHFPNWSARMIGRRSTERRLNERLDALVGPVQRLSFESFVPFEEVIQATRRAAIAVVNSSMESFGRVAIEAFAGEAALISSAEGGLAEVIGNAALRIETRRRSELASALHTLLTDCAYRQALARAGRDRFESNFTMRNTADALDSIYERFLLT